MSMESDEFVEALRALSLDVFNYIDGMRRRISQMELDQRTMQAMLRFQEEQLTGASFLPHQSIRRIFKVGELREHCLEALRRSGGMLDTRELTIACMARKGLDTQDILMRRKIVFSVIQALKTARRSGFVETCGKRKGVLLWRFKSDRAPIRRVQ